MKVFPILYQGIEREPGWPIAIEWDEMEFFEHNVKDNHSQNLSTVAKRGGLSPRELFAVMKGLELKDQAALPSTDAEAINRMINWPIAWVYGQDFVKPHD
jgi:hypothetical protein